MLYHKVESLDHQTIRISMSTINTNPDDNVYVGMNESKISNARIHTNSLGPCVAFLIDCVFNGAPLCYLEHYLFDIDESSMSRKEVLELFLTRICEDLKDKLEVDSIKPNDNQTDISEAQLIIAGGDVYENYLIKNAFTSLNEPSNNDITQLKVDSETLYLYQQLLNRTIILKSVSRNLPDHEDSIVKFDKLIYKH